MQNNGDASVWDLQINTQWPEAGSTLAPPDCPANVANFFRQATESLNVGNYDAAGMMFRKTLESATKAIDGDLVSMTLVKRIKELVQRNLITPALGEWAHEIRLGGNEAAHDDDLYSEEDSEALHNFSENFLRYTFTLPAAVARRSVVKPSEAG